MNCGDPPVVDNAERHYTNITYGSTVTYKCDKGYAFNNSIMATSICDTESHDVARVTWTGVDTACSSE